MGLEKNKLSVVVPVYNVEDYIRECVESIRKQTFQNLEIILVDDGSTDGSGEICDECAARDDRVRVIHQENRGLRQARKSGIDAANGEFLTFVDSDDWIEPEMYGNLLPFMEHVDLVSSGALKELKCGSVTKGESDLFEAGYYSGERLEWLLERFLYDFDEHLERRLRAPVVDKIFRTEIVQHISFYPEYPVSYAEDQVFLVQYLLRASAVQIVGNCFYHYRYRTGSILNTTDDGVLININHVYLILKREILQMGGNPCLLRQLQKYIINNALKQMVIKMQFDEELLPILYPVEAYSFHGKKTIVFGAGTCGRDCYRQLAPAADTLEWVASRPKTALGIQVKHVDGISDMDYDVVLVAMDNPKTAAEMKEQLLHLRVPEEKIWLYADVRIED